MTGCNMDRYIMNRKTKMLEYISVSKIQVSVSASEGVSARRLSLGNTETNLVADFSRRSPVLFKSLCIRFCSGAPELRSLYAHGVWWYSSELTSFEALAPVSTTIEQQAFLACCVVPSHHTAVHACGQ